MYQILNTTEEPSMATMKELGIDREDELWKAECKQAVKDVLGWPRSLGLIL